MQWQTSREPVPPVDPAGQSTTGAAPEPVAGSAPAPSIVTRRAAVLAAGGALALGLVGGGLAVAYTPLGDLLDGQSTTQDGMGGFAGSEGVPGQMPDGDTAVGGTQQGGPQDGTQQGGPQQGGPGGDQGDGSDQGTDSDQDSTST